ncbi:DUF3500 domain-containing protein [Pseudonocardia sp. Cha107L01]|uniref:DUF3500 domain-containing protein n=1 Tax=Pseudonocardia sp. Cha107L01 TaxID=3457576 RepID=UPI00403ED7F8
MTPQALSSTAPTSSGVSSARHATCRSGRAHSPVMLIEYDNHQGIFLDNAEPERFHVHTIVREPHGNDYGKDLLAQHYARHHTR